MIDPPTVLVLISAEVILTTPSHSSDAFVITSGAPPELAGLMIRTYENHLVSVEKAEHSTLISERGLRLVSPGGCSLTSHEFDGRTGLKSVVKSVSHPPSLLRAVLPAKLTGISIGALIGQDDSPKKLPLVGCLHFFGGKGERTLGCPPSPKRRIIGESNEKCRILVVAITGKGAHLKYTCRIGPKEICHFFQQHSGFQLMYRTWKTICC